MNGQDNYKHSDITEKIIKGYYKVYNTLGYGFLEKVYEKSLCIELEEMGLYPIRQKEIKVYYEGNEVGEYYADIIVNECVIIELKAAEMIIEIHETQLVNYLKATNIEVGLLLNFGRKAEFKRKVYSNKPFLY